MHFVLLFLIHLGELKRERDFYKSRGLSCPKDIPTTAIGETEEVVNEDVKLKESNYHRLDEQVGIGYS